MSERISIAKLREQFTLWPQVLHVLDGIEEAHTLVKNKPSFYLGIETQWKPLRDAVEPFDFEDA